MTIWFFKNVKNNNVTFQAFLFLLYQLRIYQIFPTCLGVHLYQVCLFRRCQHKVIEFIGISFWDGKPPENIHMLNFG